MYYLETEDQGIWFPYSTPRMNFDQAILDAIELAKTCSGVRIKNPDGEILWEAK